MNKTIAVLILGVVLLFSCSQQKQAIISGTVTLSDELPKDEDIYIGLYQMGFTPYFGDTLQLSIQNQPDFTFNVKPGTYTLMAMTFHSERFRIPLVVEDENTAITVHVELPAKGLADFENVYIKGGFTDWRTDFTTKLVKEGNVWVFQDTARIEPGDYYDFLINDKSYHDLNNPNLNFVQHWGSFNTQYKGGAIILDPSLYQTLPEKPLASVTGFDYYQELETLGSTLMDFDERVWDPMRKPGKRDAEFYQTHYEAFNSYLDSLQQNSEPYFYQMIQERRVPVARYHPIHAATRELYLEQADSLRYLEFSKSDLFSSHFLEMKELLESFEPTSFFLEGRLTDIAMSLQSTLDRYPHLCETYQLEQNHFINYLLEFEKQTPNPQCGGTILYNIGDHCARSEKFDEAAELWQAMKEKYPGHSFIKRGIVDAKIAGLNIRPGIKAPNFAVQTIEGDSLKLSDFQGKFLFIDFWGSWCGPCRGEIPHLKKLHANMASDHFAIIGLARDDLLTLRKFVEQENILYPNAIAPDDLLKQYGITGYPTTLLIDPEGQIIAKNLRGEHIEEAIQAKMTEYAVDTAI